MTFNTALIFTNDICPLCKDTMNFASEHGIEIEEHDGEDIGNWPDRNVQVELLCQLAMNDEKLPVIFWRGGAMDTATFKENVLYW